MAFFTDDVTINTMIGPGSFIKGNLAIAGFMRIDGDLDGNLETSGRVIIGEKARIRGNVIAMSAIVCGIVEGDVVAPENVEVSESAAVLGDIISRRVQIAEGVIFHGYCISCKKLEDFTKAKVNWQNRKAIKEKSYFSDREIT